MLKKQLFFAIKVFSFCYNFPGRWVTYLQRRLKNWLMLYTYTKKVFHHHSSFSVCLIPTESDYIQKKMLTNCDEKTTFKFFFFERKRKKKIKMKICLFPNSLFLYIKIHEFYLFFSLTNFPTAKYSIPLFSKWRVIWAI